MDDDANADDPEDVRITVEAPTVEAIADAFDLAPPEEDDGTAHPDELQPVVSTLADVYRGVAAATEEDSRGRSRKMVREYAGREDLESDEVGHLLRALEAGGLVVQDGNRWRLAKSGGEG